MREGKMRILKAVRNIVLMFLLILPLGLVDALAAEPADDYLSASGGVLYDDAGNTVRLTGIAWFGFETSNQVYHGLWSVNMEDTLDTVADNGFNLLRIPLCVQLVNQWRNGTGADPGSINYSVNPDLQDLTSLEVLDASIAYCKQIGLKVMLDMHRVVNTQMLNTWYTDDYPSSDFEACWQWLAQRYADDDTVIAVDLFNEPHGSPGESDMAKWDDTTDQNNWRYEAEKVADLILDANPNLLVVIEGVEATPKDGYTYANTNGANYDFNWWGGNLRRVGDYPVDLGNRQNKLVYSPHDYGPGVYAQTWFYSGFTQDTLIADCWEPNWLYIAIQDMAPLLIGEWGGIMDGGDNETWMKALSDTIAQYELNHTFWCVNPNSGDTGGILLDDWQSVDATKYNLIEPTLWQDADGKFIGLDHEVNLGADGTHVGAAAIPSDDDDDDVSVTGVSVSPTSTSIKTGATAALTATITPSDASDTSVSWTSSDTRIATVSTSGVVTGVSSGSALITVTTQDGSYESTCTVTITGSESDDTTSAPCSSPEAAALPLVIDGAGEFCRVTSGSITNVNSWNMERVEINGVDYTNTWSDQMPDRIDGNYYIYYVGKYDWSHLEVNGSGGSSDSENDNEQTQEYTLTIEGSGDDSTIPTIGAHAYAAGTAVSVTATPANGATFSGWSGAATDTTNPVTITMDADKSLIANFSADDTGDDSGDETEDDSEDDSVDDIDLPDTCSGSCNAATPVAPTITSDGGIGNVTMYSTAASQGGACNYGTTDIMNYAAINVNVLPDDAQGQWQGGKICGQCAEVTALTSQGLQTVVVRIVDKCADENCGIDLGGDAPATIMLDGSGLYTGKWRFVSCDGHSGVSDGDPSLDVLQGSNAWWSRVHVRNGSSATDTIAWQEVDGTASGTLPFATNPENAFEVPVDGVLQSGMSAVLITVHYADGTTATVTLTPDELATPSASYPLD